MNSEAEQQIRAVISDWLAAVARKDSEAISRFYTRDGRFLVPNAPAAEGRQAIASMWGHLLGLPNVSLTFGPTLIEVSGANDMAYEVGTYSLGFDREGTRTEDRGKYVVVWKRTEDGWRAAADILNSDLPAG